MFKGKKLTAIIVVLAMMLVLVGCNTANEAPEGNNNEEQSSAGNKSGDPEILAIASSSMGGNFFVLGGAVATVLNKQGGFKTSVQVTGGGRDNMLLTDSGDVSIGFGNHTEAYKLYNEEGKTNLRTVAGLWAAADIFITFEDSPYENVTDLEQARVHICEPGSDHNNCARQVFDLLDINPKALIEIPKGEAPNLMGDGMVDAFACNANVIPKWATLADLETIKPIKALDLGEENIDKLMGTYPYLSVIEIPEGAYSGQKKTVHTVGAYNSLFVNKDLSDEAVYKITETLFENRDSLVETLAVMENAMVGYESILNSIIPLHPGAVKFYQDQGIDIPESLLPPQ